MPVEPYATAINGRSIVVFDGNCVLCSANAQFILRHDRRGVFLLTTMQSEAGNGLYRRFGIDPTNPETFIIAKGDECLRQSDAVLDIWANLDWPWRALTVFRLVPRPIRDWLYRLVARNRYRVFGRRDTCWVPSKEQSERIL